MSQCPVCHVSFPEDAARVCDLCHKRRACPACHSCPSCWKKAERRARQRRLDALVRET